MKSIATLAIVTFALMPMFLAGQDKDKNKAALARITAAYDKIEAEHESWAHYTCAAENLEGGQSYEHHVWKSDGDDGLIKVESSTFDDHGENRVQFYFKGSDLLFTLDRSETSLMIPGAPNKVTETRYYFAGGQLIRQLEKKGQFPPGKPTDTADLKNREVNLSELETAAETYTLQHEMAAAVIEKLRSLDGDE